MKPRKKLIIFDLDGTLFDSAPDYLNASNEILQRFGRNPIQKHDIFNGLGFGLRELLFKITGLPESQMEEYQTLFKKAYLKRCTELIKPYPGVLDYLTQPKPVRWALITNKSLEPTLEILKHFSLYPKPWVEVIAFESYPKIKPDPYPFLHLMKKAHVSCEETLMVGDGEPDILGAQQAGIESVGCLYGYLSTEKITALAPTYTVRSFQEFISLAAKL